MSSSNYRERLRNRQGPASLNPSFRPALANRRRDPVQAVDEFVPDPVEEVVEEPVVEPPAPPPRETMFDAMKRIEDQRAIDGINALPIATEPVAQSSAAADEDDEPVEDATDPLPNDSASAAEPPAESPSFPPPPSENPTQP